MDGDETVMSIEATDEKALPYNPPKDKKKKKKKGKHGKKKTREMIIMERLNKLVDQYKTDEKKYNQFVERIDRWFAENLTKIMSLFVELDSEKVGELTYEKFKAGMLDYNIPCNLIELHLLCTLLDTDGNFGIDFNEFDKGIRYFSLQDKFKSGVVEAESSPYRGLEQEIKLLEPNERIWISCTFKMVTFEEHKYFFGHFTEVVTMQMYIAHLIQIVKSTNEYSTNMLQFYSDSTRSIETLLAPDKTLEELGFHGGSYYQPKDLVLFYDFDPTTFSCPLVFN